MNQELIAYTIRSTYFIVDMNSFFWLVGEQQTNYWLRGRPVAVCVYTGKYGCVIAPSIEAKIRGLLGMRLNEALNMPQFSAILETNPDKYRTFHAHIMKVLKSIREEVIPRSIDEAVVDLSTYKNIYPDVIEVANKKKRYKRRSGDWLNVLLVLPMLFWQN